MPTHDKVNRFFWCESHQKVHRQGDDTADCLLVGPFSTEGQAATWNKAIPSADLSRKALLIEMAERFKASAEHEYKTPHGKSMAAAFRIAEHACRLEAEHPKCKVLEGMAKDESAAPSSERAQEGDAYFFVGYEDTPGFAIARSKDEVRAALCEVIYGGSLTPADEETKEEIDSHMEWFEDDDHWSIDRSHWSVRYEIGGLEAWRFPANLLNAPNSATSPSNPE